MLQELQLGRQAYVPCRWLGTYRTFSVLPWLCNAVMPDGRGHVFVQLALCLFVAVSIGFTVNKETLLGVVYAPILVRILSAKTCRCLLACGVSLASLFSRLLCSRTKRAAPSHSGSAHANAAGICRVT